MMRKKLLCTLLALCIALSGLGLGALADLPDASTPARRYDGRFADVTDADWYRDSVVSLYELGLTDGQSANSFGAASNVSLAETVSFAARVHSLYCLGSAEAGPSLFTAAPGGEWYAPYAAYLIDASVIDSRFDGIYSQSATRAQTAYILSRVLPAQELGAKNAGVVSLSYETGRYITDVTAATPYAAEIISLYSAGIVTGSDASGSFLPESEITRAELAAMLVRLVYPEKRVTIDWDPYASPAAAPDYPGLVWESGQYIPYHSVDDTQAILANVRWLFQNGETDIKLSLGPEAATPAALDLLLDEYIDASQLYIEQGYTAVNCKYDTQGNMTISFYNPNGGDRDAALKKAVELHDRFHADGTITPGMSQTEIARVYAEYLCRTCEYDNSSQRVSHTAYGALINGLAVCEGYTAAFNILLKLEGINCSTEQFPNHIWTTTTLDGVFCHIDVTWCDQSYGFENLFFCMTPEFSMGRDQTRTH